ncbi:hypothetical protein [Nocardia sp. CA-120079]|uniref:hypothetical protein n=1 Tax=Nocardia sp. CA-120079 TaxID=3239974 RepID=UPI003D96563E
MAKKDFSKVGRGTATPMQRAGSSVQPGAARRSPEGGGGWSTPPRLWYVLGAIAAVLGVVLIIGVIRGGSTTETATVKVETAHGPTVFDDGLPSGYTRDKGGAATAAVNLVQAISKADHGRADVEKIRARMLAAAPSDTLTKVLADANGRPASEDVFSILPATVTVGVLTDQQAEVEIWALGAGQSVFNAAGQKAVSAVWGTTTVGLVWENGDWKARDWRFRVGPDLAEASAPSNDTKTAESGYFSFFIN